MEIQQETTMISKEIIINRKRWYDNNGYEYEPFEQFVATVSKTMEMLLNHGYEEVNVVYKRRIVAIVTYNKII